MYSLYKGVPGVLPRKILENPECMKRHLPFIKAYSLYFYLSLISFLYFFLLFFKIFRLFFIFQALIIL